MAMISFKDGMSGTNRSSHAIIADIMKEGLSGTLQTHIMYRANLSYSQMKDYLNWVQSSGLMIRKNGSDNDNDGASGGGLWLTTEKGREYLRLFDRLYEILDEEKGGALFDVTMHTNARAKPYTSPPLRMQSQKLLQSVRSNLDPLANEGIGHPTRFKEWDRSEAL